MDIGDIHGISTSDSGGISSGRAYVTGKRGGWSADCSERDNNAIAYNSFAIFRAGDVYNPFRRASYIALTPEDECALEIASAASQL